MTNTIYLVDPDTRRPSPIQAASFADIGIRERSDLQRWVALNAEILGEELLVLATEFDAFRNSKRRIDLLCIDKWGVLTVVELKLDAQGSHADLQAIRYAAFCSTMSREQAVAALKARRACTEEEAESEIKDFLGVDELPDFDNEPRIILAAGSMDDVEVTSAVLWLRKFGIDIRCVELTPYQIEGRVALVPKQIIPLPEAEEYVIRVEAKESAKVQDRRESTAHSDLWTDIAERYGLLEPRFQVQTISRARFQQIRIGHGAIHYEWGARKQPPVLQVSLHFEFRSELESMSWVEYLLPHSEEIKAGINRDLRIGPFGSKWGQCTFEIPFGADQPDVDVRQEAAELMVTLVERTWPLVQARLAGNALVQARDTSHNRLG